MTARRARARLQSGSLAALPLGLGVLAAAQALDGGSVRALVSLPAAMVVFGGTVAAILVSYAPGQVARALRDAWRAFHGPQETPAALSGRLIGLAVRAHRHGPAALEAELAGVADPFLRSGLALAVDGVSAETLARVLTLEKLARAADEDEPARIWDAAAGYAPTLGILGAGLGLIHVLQQLHTPGGLGAGVATAFVATVYGVGSANLLFLPVAGRLREQATRAAHRRELIAEGLVAISERTSPRLVVERLRPLVPDTPTVEEVVARLGAPGAARVAA